MKAFLFALSITLVSQAQAAKLNCTASPASTQVIAQILGDEIPNSLRFLKIQSVLSKDSCVGRYTSGVEREFMAEAILKRQGNSVADAIDRWLDANYVTGE